MQRSAWGHIISIKRENEVVAAEIRAYAEDDEYFSFIKPAHYKDSLVSYEVYLQEQQAEKRAHDN